MQLGPGAAVIPLLACRGDRKIPFFIAQEVVDWVIIYSLFTENLELFEEFLYKFKVMKYLRFEIF